MIHHRKVLRRWQQESQWFYTYRNVTNSGFKIVFSQNACNLTTIEFCANYGICLFFEKLIHIFQYQRILLICLSCKKQGPIDQLKFLELFFHRASICLTGCPVLLGGLFLEISCYDKGSSVPFLSEMCCVGASYLYSLCECNFIL